MKIKREVGEWRKNSKEEGRGVEVMEKEKERREDLCWKRKKEEIDKRRKGEVNGGRWQEENARKRNAESKEGEEEMDKGKWKKLIKGGGK